MLFFATPKMSVSSLKTEILDYANKNKVIYYGELASTVIRKYIGKNAVVIDAREIQDCKLLAGTHAFETTGLYYKHGILLDAMLKGKTLAILNIDKNTRLYNYLQSLIEENVIYADGTIETAQSGFRIFYTSTEYIENKNMITYGPIDFTLAEAFDFISETIDVKRDIRNKVAYIFEHIYDMQLTSQIDISTFYKLEILLKMNNLTTEALYDNFVKLFMAGYEENGRNEMTRNLRELLCMGEVQTIIEEKYIFDNFNVNPKNIGTIKTIVTHIANNNPIVITGETGVGKTTLIQKISENAFPLFGYHTNLVVYNMSYDVDLQELVGLYEGYPNHKIKAYRKKYKIENKNDTEFLHELCLTLQKLDDRTSKEELREVKYLITNISRRFVYKENVLLQAIKNGNWLLLDEINLAPDEVLDALNAIIEQKRIYVSERGDIVPVQFHRNFRIFGCMNPGTDYGKKYFKSNVFCEVFYDDFSSDYEQLLQIANRKLVQTENVNSEMLQKNAALIVKSKNVQNELVMLGNLSEALSLFFIDVKKGMAEHTLRGNEIEPVITGRTFTRLLSNVKMCNLHDIIDILFYTQFCVESHAELDKIIAKYINDRPAKKIMTSKYIDTEFYITKRNKRHIYMIENCIRLGLPIILQGPTSTGKTSSLYHLAKKHNVKLHRINNHENTEVSDYLGNYKCDKNGNMYFEKGILIRAMLNGDWLLLDELNLAQSEVLEVLNRLLDDNNEIMCNNEIVRPHRKFRLFATQNLNYSGRKKLSKAFRNRFIEIFYDKFYIDDIKELLVCKGLPKSYIDLISQIYDKLSSLRSYNHLITTRDIFKWIDGNIETRKDLFIAGLNATCEKQRSNIVKENILDIFECVFKIDRASYFDRMHSLEIIKSYSQNCFYASNYIIIDDFVFTKSYIKLFNLLHENYMKKNPVLVVGETGIGKTKCIEVLSKMCNRPLYTIGMHENIDSSDFVGNFTVPVTWNDGPLLKAMKEGGLLLIDEINLGQCSVLEQLNSVFETNKSIYISDINLTRSAVGDFNIFACMNPGTDFGKKELSPALRNRFTEIYFDISNEEKYDIFEVMLRRNIHDKDFCDRFIYLLQQNMHLISDLSLRKTMDVIASIKSYYKKQNVIVVKNADISADFVFGEIFASNHLESTDWDCYTENNTDYIGVHPYYIENMSSNTLPILSKMTKRNMSMLFKALLGDKPILLKGSPGVGKTSFVMQLANYLKYNCIRINLSDETEFYELCGSYMPRVENNNLTIDFVNSELVEGIQSDSWIILDEINLATQTVIEGLNSLLDHRKELYLNKTIKMTQNTRIFATMNDFCTLDGRKTLPKSFLDRFIILEMNDYNEEDIIFITNKYIRNMDTDKGTYSDTKHALVKEVNGTKIYKNLELANCTKLEKLCLDRIKIGCTLRNMFSYLKLMISDSDKVRYKYENSNFTIETASILFESRCNLDNSYTITHTNINKLLQILLCIVNNIPVIITGSIGKSMVADFVSKVLGMKKYTLYCHGEIDCNDLLGQFTYTDGRFSWQNSLLIENCMENNTLIVFDKPEHIQKAVFDRLNALFEGQKVINIHEKGIDTKTTIGQALGIVLLCNDTTGLSNAILDRCWKVQLDSNLDEIDINKICNTPCIEREEPHKKVKENDFEKDNNLCLDNITLLKNKYTPSMVTNLQNVDYNCLTFIRNTLDEAEIRDLLQLNTLHFDYSIEEMQVKGRSDYKQLLGFYKKINYNIKTHDSDFDKLKAMGRYKTIEKQIISFVKNSNLSILPEKPKNLDQLKLDIFQYITSTTIKEYKKCRRYAKLCKDLHFVCDHFAFDDYYFEFASVIFGHKCKPFDPLLLLKIEIIDRYNAKIEEVKKTIVDQFVKLYKYGRSKIEEAFDKFTKITSKTETKLRKIDNLLQRNFACHIEEFKSLNLQERISQLAATNTFSDICDYSLLRQYNTTSAIKPNTLQSLYLSQNALEIGERKKLFEVIKKYNVALNNDFCKNFFVETDTSCEMLLAENITYEIESTDNEWFNNPLNDYQNIFDKVFENLFSDRDRYTINFYPENKITITNKFYAVLKLLKTTNEDIYRKISNLSIMTTPEHIIEHYNTPEILKYYQSCNKSFDWVHNYSWLVMLHLIEFTHDRIAEYLLNTKIYQFFERQSFIKEYLQNHDPSTDTSLLYNLSLQYESFEINKKYENHKNSNIKKVWYDSTEFRKYKKILQEDTLSHITAVTINQEDYCCECETCKFDSTDSYRNNILQTLRKNDDKTCKFDIVENEELHAVCYKTFDIPNIFYNRSVAQRYTNFEIQIAKIFNEYMQIIDSLEKKQRFIVDSLFYIAVEEQICINILLLIHQILEKSKKYETENGGDGMKEGTGEKNVSEDIKQEEEICDDIKFEEIEDIAESDAVENSNEGCIDDVSNESEYSSQETIGCEEQETENDNENENSSEEIKNCDSDNNDFDDQTLSDENMDCEDEETNMNENEEQEENDENEANNYQAISGDLNDEQTCENADNYESRVNGLKLENEGAIEEQGDERVEDNKFANEDTENEKMTKIHSANEDLSLKDTNDSSTKLVNILKYVFYGNRKNKYNGDYRSGKKLNMKKIIPFVLSDYRKDKIWLKRNRKEKSDYIVRIFVDNSQSMNQKTILDRLGEIFANLAKAFEILEIPIEIYSFGSSLDSYRNREDFFRTVRFDHNSTNIDWIGKFRDGINIILTDGIFQVQCENNHNFILLLINSSKIHTMKKIIVTGDAIITKRYIDSIKIRYCIVDKIENLEEEFVSAMKELVNNNE